MILRRHEREQLRRALESKDPVVRLMGVRAWHLIGDPAAIETLLVAAGDEDMYVRGAAVDALSAFDTESTVEAIISALPDPDQEKRYVLLGALAKMSSSRAEDFLLGIVRSHPDEGTRRAAVSALGERPGDAVDEALLAALSDGDPEMRFRAACHLGFRRNERAIPSLEAALRDPEESVQWVAASALARIGSARALPGLLRRLGYDTPSGDPTTVIASLAGIIDPEHNGEAAAAAAALRLIGGDQVVPPLETGLRRGDGITTSVCADALALLGTPGAITALISALSETTPNTFLFAALALCDISCREAIPALVQVATTHPYTDPQCTAIHVLGKLGGPEAAATVSGALESRCTSVQGAAAGALGDLGDPACIPALSAMVRNPLHSRRPAADALWKIGGDPAVRALLAGTECEYPPSDMSAEEVLALLNTPEGKEMIREMIEEEEEEEEDENEDDADGPSRHKKNHQLRLIK